MVMLQECNNDVNETTSRLIDSKYFMLLFWVSAAPEGGEFKHGCARADPFSQVLGKKDKKKKVSRPIASRIYIIYHAYVRDDTVNASVQKEEERKKDGSKVIEVRRQPNTGQGGDRRNRDRGPRTSLDRNGPDRSTGRGASHHGLLNGTWPSQVCDGFFEGGACCAGRPQPARHEEDAAPSVLNGGDLQPNEDAKAVPVPEPASQRCTILQVSTLLHPSEYHNPHAKCDAYDAGRPTPELQDRLDPPHQPQQPLMYGSQKELG